MAFSQYQADVDRIRTAVARHRVADQAAVLQRELARFEGPAQDAALALVTAAFDFSQALFVAAQHEVVVLIHGIRTEAPWEEMVRNILQEPPRRVVVPLRYGRFDALRFWFPFWTRARQIRRILLRLQAIQHQHVGKKVSVIAHSFGTYAVGNILLNTPNLVLHRLVLCGSILPRDYRWDHVSHRLQSDVMNECGTRDGWPVLAGRYTWGCGASGTYGFGTAAVYDRFHDCGHSDYFSPDFPTTYWQPLFESGNIVPPPGEEQRGTPLWLRIAGSTPLKLLLIAVLLVAATTLLKRCAGAERLALAIHLSKELPAGADQFDRRELERQKSIAVLPIANVSDDRDSDYFADGLTDYLIQALSESQKLRVISRSSSLRIKGKAANYKAAAEQLNVGYFLAGTVKLDAGRVHVVVELIDAARESQLWSRMFDRDVGDIFTVQAQIAQLVASTLKASFEDASRITAIARPPSGNVDAYIAYLRGYDSAKLYDKEHLQGAIKWFDEALRLDPHYALAQAEKSQVLGSLGNAEGGTESAPLYMQARQAAHEAIKIDPTLAKGYVSLGWLKLTADWDLTGAAMDFDQAMALAPRSSGVLHAQALIAAIFGRHEDAIKRERQAIELDPLYAGYYANLCAYLIAVGRYEEAQVEGRRGVDLQPEFPWTHAYLAIAAIKSGNNDVALEYAKNETFPQARGYAMAVAQFGQRDDAAAKAALDQFIREHSSDSPYQIASIYAFCRDVDGAFVWLDEAVKTRDSGVLQILSDPFLGEFSHDRRFAEICERLGLHPR